MKTNILCAIFALAFVMSGCRSSKSPIDTFVMPCSEQVSENGVIHAWASGQSDSKTAARQKAQINALADLATKLNASVGATTDKYISTLGEGEQANKSKTFLNTKIQSTVKQTLTNAKIICDQWTEDKATGQFTNYIMMEINGKEYMDLLFEELSKNREVTIDKEILNKLFLENIEKSNK